MMFFSLFNIDSNIDNVSFIYNHIFFRGAAPSILKMSSDEEEHEEIDFECTRIITVDFIFKYTVVSSIPNFRVD